MSSEKEDNNEFSPAMRAFLRETPPDQDRGGEIPASEEELRFEAAWMEMIKRKSGNNEPSPAIRAFLKETPPDQDRGGEIPASEEEVRLETAWKDMLARRRAKQSQTESGNDPDHQNPNDPPAGKGTGGRTPS